MTTGAAVTPACLFDLLFGRRLGISAFGVAAPERRGTRTTACPRGRRRPVGKATVPNAGRFAHGALMAVDIARRLGISAGEAGRRGPPCASNPKVAGSIPAGPSQEVPAKQSFLGGGRTEPSPD